jgi:hypothetical protein
MNRRQFLATGATLVTASTAGCLLGLFDNDNAPPPRRSNLVEEFSVSQGSMTVDFVSPGEQWLMSRRDVSSGTRDDGTNQRSLSRFSTLSPFGVAAAKGRGASGRGRPNTGSGSRPETGNGFLWFGGGAYVGSWYNNHEEQVDRYDADIDEVGIAYLGTNQTFRESAPGPGPVGWEDTYDNPDGELDIDQSPEVGWHRVGANVVTADGTADFGWESYDLRLQTVEDAELEITEQWKVSPRI